MDGWVGSVGVVTDKYPYIAEIIMTSTDKIMSPRIISVYSDVSR